MTSMCWDLVIRTGQCRFLSRQRAYPGPYGSPSILDGMNFLSRVVLLSSYNLIYGQFAVLLNIMSLELKSNRRKLTLTLLKSFFFLLFSLACLSACSDVVGDLRSKAERVDVGCTM